MKHLLVVVSMLALLFSSAASSAEGKQKGKAKHRSGRRIAKSHNGPDNRVAEFLYSPEAQKKGMPTITSSPLLVEMAVAALTTPRKPVEIPITAQTRSNQQRVRSVSRSRVRMASAAKPSKYQKGKKSANEVAKHKKSAKKRLIARR
jgi:hypothetical protein